MYVATSEVAALKHELRDNAVEGRTSVAEALLAGAESTEVLSCLWDYIVVEVEADAAGLLCKKKVVSCLAIRGKSRMTMSTMSTEELYRKQDLLCMPNGHVRNKSRCYRWI